MNAPLIGLPLAAQALLRSLGRDPAEVQAMPGDFSARRYWRVAGAPPLLIMDCTAVPETFSPFIAVAHLLAAQGLTVPQIHGLAEGAPVAALEDLGDHGFGLLMGQGVRADVLLEPALDVLTRLGLVPLERIPAVCPVYDQHLLATQSALFIDRLVPLMGCRPVTPEARAAWVAAWAAVLEPVLAAGRVLIHRDFHFDNLIGRVGPDGLGLEPALIDFQDAGAGPLLYDLVSLVEDPRHALPDQDIQTLAGMMPSSADLSPDQVQAHWIVLAAQRLTRIAGVLATRPSRQPLLTQLWPRWQELIVEPELEPVRLWLQRRCGDLPYEVPLAQESP